MTLDGKIASKSGDSHISSPWDLTHLHRLRASSDAVMIGIGTLLSDNPALTVRLAKGRNPFRIVVDSQARTPPNSRILSRKDRRTIIVVSKTASKSRVKRLQQAGAKVVRCGARKVDLKVLLTRLSCMGIKRILLEGGGNLNWSMLTKRLVHEVRVAILPVVVGGEKSKTLVEGAGVTYVAQGIRLSLIETERHGDDLVITYKVKNAE